MAMRKTIEVALEADGRTYTLRFDINAIAALEELLSTPEKEVSWQDIVPHLNRGSIRYVRAVFWAALRRYHPEMTLDGAGDLVTSTGMPEAMAKLTALADSTQADPQDAKALGMTARPRKAQGKALDGTGGRSGAMRSGLA